MLCVHAMRFSDIFDMLCVHAAVDATKRRKHGRGCCRKHVRISCLFAVHRFAVLFEFDIAVHSFFYSSQFRARDL